ncbi:MAG: VCBS repeat-containing protein [Myxococcales bacterium]|nr:VCBS repeat-containing protein [Myxococcales bacterium]
MIGLLALWACGGAVAPPAPIPVTPLVPPTCARTRRVLTPTWGEGHFSYAAAVVRSGSSTFAVSMANGHDHELDNVFLLPEGEGSATPNAEQRFFTAVASADLCGDGTDELAYASLAGADGLLGHGDVRLVVDGVETVLVDGLSALTVAFADLDVDGTLDLVVGTAVWEDAPAPPAVSAVRRAEEPLLPMGWSFPHGGQQQPSALLRSAAPTGIPVTKMRAQDMTGPALVLWGRRSEGKGCSVTFDTPVPVPGPIGVTAVRVGDIDRDGALDLLLAGRSVAVVPVHGRTFGTPIPLPTPGSQPTHYWMDADLLPADGGGTWVAATRACYASSECLGLLDPSAPTMGVDLWRLGADTPEHAFTPIQGVPGAARFAELDGLPGTDLLVGWMLSAATGKNCGTRGPAWEGWCPTGDPTLASGVSRATSPGLLDLVPISPMSEPPMVVRATVLPAPASGEVCGCARAGGVAVYDGPKTPVGARFTAAPCPCGAEPPATTDRLPTAFQPGDRFATTSAEAGGVVFSVADAPPLLLSNAWAKSGGANDLFTLEEEEACGVMTEPGPR